MPAPRALVVTAVALTAAAALSACDSGDSSVTTSNATGSDASPSTTVKRDELQKDMLNKLNASGSTIEKVECPDTVPAVVGATTTCKVTAKDGQTKDYEVKITSVNGTDVGYSANPK